MPRQWWLVMRPDGPAGRMPRAVDCNGLINRIWPTADREHQLQKPFVMHGWPTARGVDLVWSWTWLDDTREPPVDPAGQVGRRWTLGDDRLRVVAAGAGPQVTWEELLTPTWSQPGGATYTVTAHSPVVQSVSTGRGAARTRRHLTTMEPSWFFGRLPATGRSVVTQGRENGLFSAAARYAHDDRVAAELLTAGRLVVPHLQLTPGPDWRLVDTVQPHVPDRPGQGWVGTVQVSITSGDPICRHALAVLLYTASVVGLGTGTAYGHGSITARPRFPGAPVGRSRLLRTGTAGAGPQNASSTGSGNPDPPDVSPSDDSPAVQDEGDFDLFFEDL